MNEIQKSNRGGKRAGAGRPKTNRVRCCFQLTPEEKEVMATLLSDIRQGYRPPTLAETQKAYAKAMKAYTSQQGTAKARALGVLTQCGQLLGMTYPAMKKDRDEQSRLYDLERAKAYEESQKEIEKRRLQDTRMSLMASESHSERF